MADQPFHLRQLIGEFVLMLARQQAELDTLREQLTVLTPKEPTQEKEETDARK